MNTERAPSLRRRGFMKLSASALGAAVMKLRGAPVARAIERQRAAVPAPERPFAAPPLDEVRIGYVGVGLQGSAHCRNLLDIAGARLTAVCDIVPERVARVQAWVAGNGQPRPTAYDRGERDFERLCQTEDLDLVYTATPCPNSRNGRSPTAVEPWISPISRAAAGKSTRRGVSCRRDRCPPRKP